MRTTITSTVIAAVIGGSTAQMQDGTLQSTKLVANSNITTEQCTAYMFYMNEYVGTRNISVSKEIQSLIDKYRLASNEDKLKTTFRDYSQELKNNQLLYATQMNEFARVCESSLK